MPAVTATALLIACGLLATSQVRWRLNEGRYQTIALIGLFLLTLLAGVGLKGNLEISATEEAVPNLHRASRLSRDADRWAPWSELQWLAVGAAASSSGDRAVALRAYSKAIERSPSDWRAWFGLASAATGERRKQALGRAHALNPLGPE
jgi:tetratricopeptide (TPR) repeat protein